MQFIIIVLLILAIFLIIFTLQNSIDLSINVLFWEITNAPLVLIVISCIALGYIVASFYFYPKLWKIKKENNQLNKSNTELKEVYGINQDKFETEEEKNPEGIMLEKEDDTALFFKD